MCQKEHDNSGTNGVEVGIDMVLERIQAEKRVGLGGYNLILPFGKVVLAV